MMIERMRGSPPGAKHFRGFTLVEALIAIAIGALVITSAYASFSLGIRTRGRLTEATSRLQETRAFFDQLSRELRSAISFHPHSLTGDSRSIRFHAFLPRELAVLSGTHGDDSVPVLSLLSPVIIIEYSGVREGDAFSVVKRVSNLREELIEERAFELGLSGVTFSYREHDADSGGWIEEWQDRDDFPGAVRLSLEQTGAEEERTGRATLKTIILPGKQPAETEERSGES